MHWIEILQTLAFHFKSVRLGAQNLYYDVTALAAAAQCRKTRQEDTTSWGRHGDLSTLHVTSLDQSYFIIRHINYMRYNNKHVLLSLEGDLKICPTLKIHFARGPSPIGNEFSGWDKSLYLPTNWTVNCLLYRKLKYNVIRPKHCTVSHNRETRRLEGNTTICLPSTWRQ